MSAEASVDVAIIGGGPVGMALACELNRHGLSFRIFDKAPATKSYSRAPIFWPRAQEALDLMGLHALWDGQTKPMRRMNVNVYGQPAGVVDLDVGESSHPVPMLVGQDVTERILDTYLAGLGKPVERGVEAVGIDLDPEGAAITLRMSDGATETVDAAWVVGCEGTKSLVRSEADLGWDGHALKGLMVPVADAQAKWTLPEGDGDAYVALTDRGYLLAIPLPGIWRVIVAIPDTTPDGEEPKTTLEALSKLTSEALGGPVELSDPAWVAVVRYGNYIARRFRNGRALLAGDAAHAIAPLSGQGMNTGVQDAFDLAWKLAYVHKGWAPDKLLDSYESDRRPVAERLVQATNRFFKAVQDPSDMRKTLARTAAPVALKLTKVRETIAGFYTETDVQYADSPLNDVHHGHHPRPGEHIRDGDLVRWLDLAPMRLCDALRGTHWTAIIFSGADCDASAINQSTARLSALLKCFGLARLQGLLIVGAPTVPEQVEGGRVPIALDAWRQLHGRYGAGSGALLLIRPDGYVALHRNGKEASYAALEDLLTRTLSPKAEHV